MYFEETIIDFLQLLNQEFLKLFIDCGCRTRIIGRCYASVSSPSNRQAKAIDFSLINYHISHNSLEKGLQISIPCNRDNIPSISNYSKFVAQVVCQDRKSTR